jgi:galactokinase
MSEKIRVSTPSRLCLFGEHQDYLGLEVIAVAINLRFRAAIERRNDSIIHIRIRDSRLNRLDATNKEQLYQTIEIDLKKPIKYRSNRDYLLSCINLLQREGYPLTGFDIQLDSEIPIGKGMCSSSTMVVVLIKALLEGIQHPDRLDPRLIAELGFRAEVLEFHEPGGKMDHYTSALGGMVHIDFGESFQIEPLASQLSGCFILIDSLQQKNTTKVLAESKIPTQEALEQLEPYGITSVRDFFAGEQKIDEQLRLLRHLDAFHQRKLMANIENYAILMEGRSLLNQPEPDSQAFGQLLNRHHVQLRDGLGISTPLIESLLDAAQKQGAWGGKINGSGGGGCCFVYADHKDADRIISTIQQKGYPARKLEQDSGVRREDHATSK